MGEKVDGGSLAWHCCCCVVVCGVIKREEIPRNGVGVGRGGGVVVVSTGPKG